LKDLKISLIDDCQNDAKSVSLRKRRAKFLLKQIPQEWNGQCGGLTNQVEILLLCVEIFVNLDSNFSQSKFFDKTSTLR
jgi:hypothetical protein